jgi:hypothetical protein
MKLRNSRLLTVAGIGIATVLVIGGTATAASRITAHDIATGAANSRVIKDGSVHQEDMNPNVVGLLHRPDVLGSSVENFTTNPQTITAIGGSFAALHTDLGSFSLPAGTYLITGDGFFHSDTATSGLTRLQLAIRGDDGTTFGQDYGTCFTGLASATANREASCTTVRTITLSATQTIKVQAFGYADDTGSADSGKFVVTPNVSVIKVG